MKKILSVFLGALLLVPSLSFAQATSTPETTKAQLIAALYQELAVLEQEIQQIIAAQATLQTQQQTIIQNQQATQNVDTGSSATGPTTPPEATSTPVQYPTPEVLNVVNNNATFSPDNAQNGFTMGTFTIAYSGPWLIYDYPIQTSSPLINNSLIIQLQGNGGDCIQNGQQVLCGPFYGKDTENLMIGLNILPPPGTYTVSIPVFSLENETTGGVIKVNSQTLSFTFQVSPSQAQIEQEQTDQQNQQVSESINCLNAEQANAKSSGLDASQALERASITCPIP